MEHSNEKKDISMMKEQFLELKPLQEKHLEILKELDKFCAQNGIKWSLAFGSALGARRHGGPIPWDDDVDIVMTSADYKKFRKLFYEKGNQEKFYLQERISVDGMAIMPKLRLNGTTFIEESLVDLDMHHGIYIDIFILHNAPKSKIMKIYGSMLSFYLNLKLLSDQGYNKRKSMAPLMWILRILPKHFGLRYILKFQWKWDKKESNELAEWFIFSKFIPKNVILPPRKIKYDGIELWGPNKIDKYLKIWYGEWKKVPNLDQINWNQHSTKWSTTEDFRKYAPNIVDFSDEMGKRKI